MSGPAATFAQFAGSNVNPSGSFRPASSLGSIPRSLMSLTLKSGPKLDLTSTTLLMSTFATGVADEHPARTQAAASASNILDIVANLPKRIVQLRNVDTVLASRSAANRGGRTGSAEPGSVVSVVNA